MIQISFYLGIKRNINQFYLSTFGFTICHTVSSDENIGTEVQDDEICKFLLVLVVEKLSPTRS